MTLLKRFRELRIDRPAELFLLLLPVFAAIFLVYLPLQSAGFLPWDDDYNILNNPFYVTNYFSGVWKEPYYGMYIPVTSTVWGLLYKIFGADPVPFRVLNLVLHLANTSLVALILVKLFKRFQFNSKMILFFAVGVFALHPLQVAAVGWISGGRDLLSTFFALFSVLVLVSGVSFTNFAIATLLFGFGLLSKPQVAALPVAIAFVCLVFEKRKSKPILLLMALWFAMAIAEAAITFHTQSEVVKWSTPLLQRPLVTLDTFGFYLQKTFWPANLAVDYGRTPERSLAEISSFSLAYLLTASASLVALTYWSLRRDRKYALLFSWFFLLGPVSGVVNFGFQEISTVADHYNYLAIAVVAAFSCFLLSDLRMRVSKPVLGIICVAILLIFGIESWRRTFVWADRESFFSDMAEKNQHSFSAMIGLGAFYCTDKKDYDQGLTWMGKALAERPLDPVAIADASYCLFQQKKYQEILALSSVLKDERYLERAGHHDVALASLLSSLASAAFYSGHEEKAFFLMCQANLFNPIAADIRKNLETLHLYFAAKEGQPRTCVSKLDIRQLAPAMKIIDEKTRIN